MWSTVKMESVHNPEGEENTNTVKQLQNSELNMDDEKSNKKQKQSHGKIYSCCKIWCLKI